MTFTVWILLGIAGGLGAISRWGLDLAVKSQLKSHLELGIVVVNITACLLIGFVAGYFFPTDDCYQIIATGFLGGFSTFSTHIVDIVKLLETGRYRKALLILIGTLVASILAAIIGFYTGQLFS